MKMMLALTLFVLRHSIAVAGFAMLTAVLWTVVYAVLLAVAIVFYQDVGGPLAYPAGLIVFVLASLAFGAGVCAPAAGVGRLVCALLGLPRLLSIPVVFVAGLGFVWLWHSISIGVMTTSSIPPVTKVMWEYLIFLSIPLGLYWWLTEGPGAVTQALWRWLRSFRQDSQPAS